MDLKDISRPWEMNINGVIIAQMEDECVSRTRIQKGTSGFPWSIYREIHDLFHGEMVLQVCFWIEWQYNIS